MLLRLSKMSSKHELRQLEEDMFENNEMDDDSLNDELPPTYSSLFSEDLLLSPPTTADERRESILIAGMKYAKKVVVFESPYAK